MIYLEVNFSTFCDHFDRMGRKDQFTYEGLKALYRFFNDLGEDLELDVFSICCDWSEYTEEELMKEYNRDEDHEDFESLTEWINDRTTLLETEGDTYLIMTF